MDQLQIVQNLINQGVEAVFVEFGGHDAFADAPDGVPIDAQEPGDGGLVGLGREVRGHVFEVAGEPGPVAGERYRFDQDAVFGAVDAAQAGTQHHGCGAEVQVPPVRRHRAGVVAGPGRERAQRAGQPPGP